jgi:DNA-directed RNA polymerase subunit H (RpoH/RPB5)
MTSKTTSSGIISLIYKSRKNILDLMKRQGYNIAEYDNFSINEVNSMTQNKQLDILLENVDESGLKKKIYIRYYLEKTMNQKIIEDIIDDLFNLEETLTKNDTLFIICKEDSNETMVNLLKHIWEQDKIFIIIQGIKRLQFNILDHSFVPSHRILNKSEIITVKQKYNISDEFQFPDISRFDPVAQAIGIRPGEVCEIIRPSKTAISGFYYRICIN